MAATAEKPTTEELAGRAVNASVLLIHPSQGESPLLRVAALACASMQIANRTDRPPQKPDYMSDALWHHVQRAVVAVPTERDKIQGDLAGLLVRLRVGRDLSESSVTRAVVLYAAWVSQTHTWSDECMRVHRPLVRHFAAQCLLEWLFDICQHCGGAGEQELLRDGRTRRPRLFETGRARLVACRACNGSRMAQPDIAARVDALGINWGDYKAGGWERHFARGRAWLGQIARRINRPLRSQLNR